MGFINRSSILIWIGFFLSGIFAGVCTLVIQNFLAWPLYVAYPVSLIGAFVFLVVYALVLHFFGY
jgi:hypothetical protein